MAKPSNAMQGVQCDFIGAQIESIPRATWTDEMREAIESHLVDCELCRFTMAVTENLDSDLRSLPHLEPPPEMAERILLRTERIARENQIEGRVGVISEVAPAGGWQRLGWVTAGGVAVFASVLTVSGYMSGDPQSGILSFLNPTGIWSAESDFSWPIATGMVVTIYLIGVHFFSAGAEQGDIVG